jgi:1-acyl-sn-glycerol-3-phosphate acyltransferase
LLGQWLESITFHLQNDTQESTEKGVILIFGPMPHSFSVFRFARRGIDYILSPLYLLHFCLTLLVFHPLQVLAFRLGGREGLRPVVDWMNASLSYGLWLIGSRVRFRFAADLPTNRPLIFVANHQSLFDIPPMAWWLRRYRPLFVSKKELARGTPGVSYNLRHSGAALIDRKDPRQAMVELGRLGTLLKTCENSVIIFPEGTRSHDNVPKPFAGGGLAILLKKAPNALVVPVAIRNTGRFNPQGLFPLRAFTAMSWTILAPIDPTGLSADVVAAQAREAIILAVSDEW